MLRMNTKIDISKPVYKSGTLLTETKDLPNGGTSSPISAVRIESQLFHYICALRVSLLQGSLSS
jgi:hypothetical protein